MTAGLTAPRGSEGATCSRLARAALKTDRPFAVLIRPAAPFWPAEDYHQGYCRTHPIRYSAYRVGCRRDHRLAAIWGTEAGGH